MHTEALRRRKALRTLAAANLRLQKPVADGRRDRRPMIYADQCMHHVERGDSAGAGEAVAINLKQRVAEVKKGKRLREGRNMLPVDRASVSVKQACLGEKIRSCRHATQPHAMARDLSQEGKRWRRAAAQWQTRTTSAQIRE